MTSETKISLLIGLGMVLVIGIVISDQLAVPDPEASAPLLRFAESSGQSGGVEARTSPGGEPRLSSATRSMPIPTPAEAELARQAQDVLAPTPGVPAIRIEGSGSAVSAPVAEVAAPPAIEPARPVQAAAVSEVVSQPIVRSERVTAPQRVLRIESDRPRPTGRVHTVESGENLSAIAERYYGERTAWRKVAEANRDVVGDNGLITPGMKLSIPDVEPSSVVPTAPASATRSPGNVATVQTGDTLAKLAARHLGDNNRWDEIYALNRDILSSPDRVLPGMEIKLPGSVTPSAAPTSTRSTSKPSAKSYTVKTGDSLSSIAAEALGSASRWDEIYELNRDKLSSPDRLILGDELRLPER